MGNVDAQRETSNWRGVALGREGFGRLLVAMAVEEEVRLTL